MTDWLQGQKWVVALLPGFIALFSASFVSDLPQVRDSLIPFVFVGLTTISFALPLGAIHLYHKINLTHVSIAQLWSSPPFLASVLLCSVALGLLVGIAQNRDTGPLMLRSLLGKSDVLISSHTELLRLLFREQYETTFVEDKDHGYDGNSYLELPTDRKANEKAGKVARYKDPNVFVQITLDDGHSTFEAYGVVHSFYSHDDPPQVYLSPACTMTGGGKVEPVKGPGIWVSLKNIESVEFQYQSCSPCATILKSSTGNGLMIEQCPFDP